MIHASLFSGIGGFDLAAEWMGWENVFNCEIDPFCQKVLKYHFPNAIQLGDIKQAKFKRDERGNVYIRRDGIMANADSLIWGTGRQCEPGKQPRHGEGVQGETDGDGITADSTSIGQGGDGSGEQSQPSTFGTRNGMDEEEETQWQNIGTVDILSGGFPCQPFSMAGKRRGTDDDRHLWPEYLRVIREVRPNWVVGENVAGITSMALSKSDVKVEGGTIVRGEDEDFYSAIYTQKERMLLDSICKDLEDEGYEVQPFDIPACSLNAPHGRHRIWIVAKNTSSSRCLRGRNGEEGTEIRQFGESCTGDTDGICEAEVARITPNAKCKRITRWKFNRAKQGKTPNEYESSCQNGAAADTNISKRCEGRLHPDGGQTERHSRTFNARDCERTTWDKFPTQPPLRSRNDGFPGGLDGITVSRLRNESIKAAGNAIVPAVAYEIFKAIEQYEITNFKQTQSGY